MNKFRWLLAALVAVAVTPFGAWAQEPATVSGRVTNAAGAPEAAVAVRLDGLNLGASSSADGSYRIVVPAARATGQVRVTASRVGLTTVSRNVTLAPGASLTQNFQMAAQSTQLQGLVVTALGITRQERTVATSVQSIRGENISRTEPNVVSALSGKVSGVQITQAGAQGGSSRIVIRGPTSLTGNNQPLFVVDGVPVDNTAPSYGVSRGYGGRDYGNAAQDINPENIASLTVLKGPNAAALYGSRAANGAIIITTKTGMAAGRKGQVSVSQYVTFENPLRLPSYQNSYGQGSSGKFSYYDGNGNGVFDHVDESWGPALDGRLIPQYNGPINASGEHDPTPWVAHPDNIRDFFDTGRTLTTNASFAASSDQANVRLSASRLDQNAMMPGQRTARTNLGLNGGLTVNSRLQATTSVQYINTNGRNRPGIGYDETNPLEAFIWFGRQVDMNDLKAHYRDIRPAGDPNAGLPYSWNYSYHPSPYFQQEVNTNRDNRDRLIGNTALTYKFADWLSGTARTAADWYSENRRVMYAAGNWGVTNVNPMTGLADNVGQNGAFSNMDIGFREINTDFLLTAKPTLSGPFSLDMNLGGNQRRVRRQENYAYAADLVVPGIFSVNNAAVTPVPDDYVTRRQVNSLYGQAEVGFNEYLFLTATGRNDWSSTLPADNRSYFYPSISGAFVFSDAIPALNLGGALSYGKIRASWARVGNDAPVYSLRDTYVASDPFGGFPTFRVPNTLSNAALKPEATTSKEFGAELRFMNDRVGLEGNFYSATTRDQIMPAVVSSSSGYLERYVNAGSVRNRGMEFQLNTTPVQRGDFKWEANVNFSRNRNEVVSLADDAGTLLLGSFWGLNVEARKGQPYGSLVGYAYKRDDAGHIVVDATGRPLPADEVSVLGNYQPKWGGSVGTTLTYKGVSLRALLDHKSGGDIYSVTHMFGTYAGVLAETAKGRCAWNSSYASDMPACTAETGIVVPNSVHADGSPNTTATNAQRYWKALYGIHEAHVFDATYTKLREASLSFDLPGSVTRRANISRFNVSIIGRNLALWSKTPHIDPETAFDASNVQGLEFAQIPTPRSIGFSFTVTP